jgi:hypothetical protein
MSSHYFPNVPNVAVAVVNFRESFQYFRMETETNSRKKNGQGPGKMQD